jgi:amidase/aspartyl-tRNA(Asn)/glutamyl-tRNA(Gln) amidotransferase subunit A
MCDALDHASALPIAEADAVCRLGAADLASAYAAGSLSPVDVARAAIARAETVQPLYNAFTRISGEAALDQARASEARWRRGEPCSAVDGVPATIKDIVWVAGWPVRYGSPSTPSTSCAADAPAVARMREAGLVFIGQTTTPEFGWKALTDGPLSGITRNPWNPELTPGGSSGGAAVAALTGAGLFHLGTDGGGSIRVPAAFTGIVGLKPTYGRVPAYPASAFGTVAHLGPMTRRVADARAMLGAMAGTDPQDWLQGPAKLPDLDAAPRRLAGLRVGYWSRPPRGTLAPEISLAVDDAVAALAREGVEVVPVDLPAGDVLDIFEVLWSAGAAARAADLSAAARDALDPGLGDIVATGERYGAVRYLRAAAARAEFGRAMEALAARFDVLVSPATAVLPFAVGHEVPPGSGLRRWFEWAGFSIPLNLSQQPAIVVPCGRSAAGLPVGLQIAGPRGCDARVLAVAEAFEAACPGWFN